MLASDTMRRGQNDSFLQAGVRFLGVLAASQPIILCLCKRVSRMQGSQVSLTGSRSSVGAQVWKSRDTSQPVKQGLPSPFSPTLR